MFCFVNKLRVVNKELKILHKTEYSRMHCRIQCMKQDLDKVQMQIQIDSGNRELWVKERELRSGYAKLVAAKLQLLRQKAKATWFKEVDANTAYFHASVKERAARNMINLICTTDDIRLYQEEKIAGEFIKSFPSLFGVAD